MNIGTDFLITLARRTGVKECPFCKTSTWVVNPSLTTTTNVNEVNYQTAWFNAHITEKDKDTNMKLNIPVVQLLCNNCGYVAHFNPYILLKELEEEPK